MGFKTKVALALVLVGTVAQAVPDRVFESFYSATGQNVRIASGADAAGEYGVSVGSNVDAADATPLFGVCENCDEASPTYVFEVTAAGNWTLDASAPLITTTSSAAGLNLGIASGANAAGEYGVVVGTTSTAVITGQGLFAVAADVDGTPVYSLAVQPVSVLGVGAQVLNTSSVAALNLAIYSGANAAGEYAVSVGTSAAVTDGTQLFGVCQDCDGTEAYVFTVSADDNVLLGATAPIVSTVSTQAGINLVLASGANASGEYGVSLGTNVAGAAGLELAGFGVDLDGTPIYAAQFETVAADGTGFRLYSTATAAGQNASLTSGANAAGEYGVVVGTDAAVADSTQVFAVCTDCDDATPDYRFTVYAVGDVDVVGALTVGGDITADTGLSAGFDISVGPAAADTAGSTLDLVAGVGGTAGVDQVGRNGGAVTITGAAGSAKNGAGATDGDGGDVVLLGGTRGGATGGTEVHGIVRVGDPTVGGTKTTTYFAVAGGAEVDGAARFDGAVTLGDAAGDDVTITGSIAADVVFKTALAGGADVSVAVAAADTAAGTFDFTGQAGGAASAGQVGRTGGALSLTGGAGSAKDGAGANDGDGGDVVLLGGARGGATGGTEVHGIVRVGSPTVGGTKTTNYFAVGGGAEVDGAARFDGAVTLGDNAADDITVTGSIASDVTFKTALAGGADITVAAGAADTAGSTLDLVAGAGGTAGVDQVGRNGGAVSLTGGAGSAKNGAGATDGDGGDLALLGGARGGATGGTEVHGIVRVGNPTVGSTKATNVLAVEGAFEVDGAARFDGTVAFNSTTTFQTGDIVTAEILDGTLLPADEANPGRGQIVICGTLDTIASNTVYYGPNTALSATGIGGMTCDTAAVGNVDEGTADAPAFTAKAFQVLGMVCRNADTNVTSVVYALRTALAATTPSVTCSVGDGVLDCVADVQTTTAIASGATIAIAASEADEAVGAVGFICAIDIAY